MIEIKRRGFMFVLSSPSGAGKTTLSRLLLEKDADIIMSISVTTRPRRPNEVDKRDYYFVDKEEYDRMAKNEELLEHAEVFGNFYGTPKKDVEKALKSGKDVLFDIDWQGTKQLGKRCREDLVSVFILPPSMEELESRLRHRGADEEQVIQQRMSKAASEISKWEAYDYVIINEDLDDSLQQVTAILRAERQRRERQHHLPEFVHSLLADK